MENKNYIPTAPLYDCADNHGTQLNQASSQIPRGTNDCNARHQESELGDYSSLSHSGSLSQQLPVSNQKSSSESSQLYAAPYEVVNKESDNTRSTPKVSTATCQQQTTWCSTIEKVSLFVLLILILIFLVSILGVVSSKNGTSGIYTGSNGPGLTPTSDNSTDEILLAVNQILDSKYLFLRPASCLDINRIPNSPSGYYSVNINKTVYCNMEELCGEKGGWTRLGYLNMSDPTQDCPANFEARTFQDIRTCRKTEDSRSCSGLTLSTNGIEYTQICGRVIGYQKGNTDALLHSSEGIDSYYLDGVSITRGSESREHVWSFVAGQTSNVSKHPENNCPCNIESTVQVPDFIGEHYYCESGNNSTETSNSKFYSDPLWDGQDCPSVESPCCTSKDLPWFHRVYDASSSSDIELRVCRNAGQSNEDILIELYEIYIK
uniref:GON domain-containing protein n=1 Tax=Amphimedon queenslandica TaxID=400682 RepID=A0A1X7VK87_AMPQE